MWVIVLARSFSFHERLAIITGISSYLEMANYIWKQIEMFAIPVHVTSQLMHIYHESASNLHSTRNFHISHRAAKW